MDYVNRPDAPDPEKSPLRHNDHPLRMIAIDIDGTITDMARRLEWDAVVALRAAEAAGIPVTLATGNVIPVSKTFGHCIGLTGPHICENGGVLYWEIPGEENGIRILKEQVHERSDADRVIAELEKRGHKPRRISSDPWRESEAALEIASTSDELVRSVIEDLGMKHLYVVSTGFACHILHKGVDKYEGLQATLKWLNEHDPRFNPEHPHAQHNAAPLSIQEVLGIGDSPNDLEMIQQCGVGVALAHAPPEVQQAADLVAERPHGAGVREVLARLGLDIQDERHA